MNELITKLVEALNRLNLSIVKIEFERDQENREIIKIEVVI